MLDFGAVFDEHHRVVWTYLARLGGRDLADELAGEVFVVAYSKRRSFDPARGEVRPWLLGIATNLWRTQARSAARRDRAYARVGVGDVHERPGDVSDVVDALRRLPTADQEVLVLYAWEDLSYEDIAAALGVPVGTVRSRLARARERLKEALG